MRETNVVLRGLGLLVDVDGVVTDDCARLDEEVLGLLAELALRGAGLAFVTGRSRRWLEEHLMPRLRRIADSDGRWADRVVVAAEMGAERTVGLGSRRWDSDLSYAVPFGVRRALRSLASEFAGSLDWDAGKRITATVEAAHSPGDPGAHDRSRRALNAWANIAQGCVDSGCEVQRSNYAVDVLSGGLNKAVGARFALTQLRAFADVRSVLVLGDSRSDVAMAEVALAAQVAEVCFAWMGASPAPVVPRVRVILPLVPFSAGTAQVLSSLSERLVIREERGLGG